MIAKPHCSKGLRRSFSFGPSQGAPKLRCCCHERRACPKLIATQLALLSVTNDQDISSGQTRTRSATMILFHHSLPA
ncbi:hypothetical protein E4T39_06581 [Aureobasidium subglaciale]|nr:hypothetical protein E4T39_06581 [Aureobasidium subglaciale]